MAKMVKEFNTNPEMEILLTRESDRTVALSERLQLTTDKKADLFISIHTCGFRTGNKRCQRKCFRI